MDIEDTTILRQPPVAGTEIETLLGALERQRGTVAWKCGKLDAAGMRATLSPSTLTLGGLLKHLALCEEDMFTWKLFGREPLAPFNKVDWEQDPIWEWRTAADDSPEQLFALWEDTIARSRAAIAEAIALGGMDQKSAFVYPDGQSKSLRRMIIDMIEEYARHAGHADLIRESIDGLVGEDPE